MAIKTEVLYLLFSGFCLQALMYVHISKALVSIEELVVNQVEDWNAQYKDSEAYLLMTTRE